MAAVLASAVSALPLAFLLGAFGLLFKARLSGDPALWKEVADLRHEMKEQRKDFDRQLREEREECAAKLIQLQAQIRELQQREQSFGRLANPPIVAPLIRAFPPQPARVDPDADLIGKLNRLPGTEGKK